MAFFWSKVKFEFTIVKFEQLFLIHSSKQFKQLNWGGGGGGGGIFLREEKTILSEKYQFNLIN